MKLSRTRFGALAMALACTTVVGVVPLTAATAAEPCPQPITYSDAMVPSCGVLWGGTGEAFKDAPGAARHRAFERVSGRTLGIYHAYYRGDQMFPFASDLELLREPGENRMLLANWKVAEGMTWRDVAAGRADRRIDAWSEHVRRTFPERFFLAIHHEPENDVVADPASGMTPQDYHDMFRHTVQRLRDNGVTNAIIVWNTMGYPGWIGQPWFETLYPGDDVVDWVAWDPYVQSGSNPSARTLLNPQPVWAKLPDGSSFPGTYNYLLARHGTKPFMIAEFGYQRVADDHGIPVHVPVTGPGSPAAFFRSVGDTLHKFPNVKALVYFDTEGNPANPVKDPPTNVDQTPASLAAWRALNRDPRLLNPPRAVVTAERTLTPDGSGFLEKLAELLSLAGATSQLWVGVAAADAVTPW